MNWIKLKIIKTKRHYKVGDRVQMCDCDSWEKMKGTIVSEEEFDREALREYRERERIYRKAYDDSMGDVPSVGQGCIPLCIDIPYKTKASWGSYTRHYFTCLPKHISKKL